MSSFSQGETEYLGSQPLARLATVSLDDQPDVAPVGFEFDGTYIYVGGLNLSATRKFRNIDSGNQRLLWLSTTLCRRTRGRLGAFESTATPSWSREPVAWALANTRESRPRSHGAGT